MRKEESGKTSALIRNAEGGKDEGEKEGKRDGLEGNKTGEEDKQSQKEIYPLFI